MHAGQVLFACSTPLQHIITCDKGAQFISQFWETLCARMGIRQAFSQAYWPRANGRAEVAGRVLMDILRKIHAQTNINWVEALPRALRIQHDAVNPITGLSPYEIMFGRPRNLAGLPWAPSKPSQDAQDFLDRRVEIDREVAEALNKAHAEVARQFNAHKKPKPPYNIGDWVWLMKPKQVGGVKIDTWWQGPYKIQARNGENSYVLTIPREPPFEVHVARLKPCIFEMELEPRFNLQVPPTEGQLSDQEPLEEPEGSDSDLEGSEFL